MNTYYTVLEIPATATTDEITAAYQRLRERYSPERVAELGAEFRKIAEERCAALDEAYTVLSDAERRAEYDRGLTGAVTQSRRSTSGGLTRREVLTALGGAVVGLLVIGLVWVISGRNAEPALPPVGELNRPAPDFTLPGLDGQDVRLSDYRGKVVLVNFWGTWCEPCKEETPALQQSYEKLGDQGLVIIGIDLQSQERNGAEGIDDVRSLHRALWRHLPDRVGCQGRGGSRLPDLPDPDKLFYRSKRHDPLCATEYCYCRRGRGSFYEAAASDHQLFVERERKRMDQRKILIVDDEPGLRDLVRINLEHEGFAVVQAENGSLGLQAVREEHQTLVIMDVMMPEMDGWEACRSCVSSRRCRC